jgi:hypothetical protein
MPSTTYAILASALPALQGPGAARLIGDASTDPATPFGGKTLATGDTDGLVRKFNKNALELDYATRVGAQGYGVTEGLTFSGSALTITVAAGKATVDGEIELPVATAVTITNTTNYIWLKRDGTLEVKTTTAAPAIPACYIGAVIAAAGLVVNYDLSGVMNHVNGLLKRKTGDTGKPTDTPGVTWAFLQDSSGASYLWDGTRYLYLAPAAAQVLQQSRYQAIAGTVTLLITDANRQIFKNTSGSSQKVLAPADAGTDWGMGFHIRSHKDSTSNVLVRNNADTATLATLTAGQTYDLEPDDDTAGSPTWPIA